MIITGLARQEPTGNVLGHHVTGNPHALCNFSVRHAIEPIQDEGFATARRQRFNRGHNALGVAREIKALLGLLVLRGRGNVLLVTAMDALVSTYPGVPILINQQVPGNPVKHGAGINDRDTGLLQRQCARNALLRKICSGILIIDLTGKKTMQFSIVMRKHRLTCIQEIRPHERRHP
jgi:hypothetical protein